MAERALSPEEVWLQDSEARLESMEILLKSVRRDIDALSEKIPSPRPGAHSTFRRGETVIHESGSRNYVLEMERGPRGLNNLGLGSHTAFEPFDDDEEAEKPEREPHPQKSWRSPSDFRQDESPPGSPTFGESSNIISLHDVILHSENVTPNPQEEASRTIPLLGSQHSLPTIEENSQEDNLFTDTDTSSISTNDELKSADCANEHRSQTAVSCARSCDTVVVAADAGQPDNSSSKRLPEETMILRREHGRRQQLPPDRPRSGSPFLSNSDSFKFSHTSLRSRDSMVSDTDSYMTVNSQLFPSGEEVYITACSDNDTPGDSPEEGRTFVRERTRQKLLILQQTTPSECHNQSDDVLEFTLVEAPACKTPTVERDVKPIPLDNPRNVPDKSFQKPVKRRALRKRRPEEAQIFDDSDTSSSSTCEEAVYDTTTAKVVDPIVLDVADETPIAVWTNRLSCIEEKSCLASGLDSSDDDEDIVVHYGENDGEEEREEVQDDISDVRLALQESASMPIAAEDFEDFDQGPFRPVEDSPTFPPSPVPTAEKPAALGKSDDDPELFVSASLSTESPQPNTMPSVMPRIHLPQLRMEERTRRARRDHHFICPKSPNAFFMGDTDQPSPASGFTTNEKPDLQQRSTQRSKSVSRLPERKFSNPGTCNGDVGVDAVQSNSSNERMYSRSCFRYRSTDIDVALATATASRENLVGSGFSDDRKKKTASSLFDLSVKTQPLTTSNLQSLNGKSTTSLLETDIDSGMQNGQQIILETDVDTLNTYRLVGGFTGSEQGTIHSNQDKAYSLFNLSSYSNPGTTRIHQTDDSQHESRADAYKRTQSLSGIAKSGDAQRSDQKAGASGLIARLRARARSNHELRVAESLTRIHVPEWLDKADLSRPISPQRREPSPSPSREKAPLPRYGTSLPSTTHLQSSSFTSLNARTKPTKVVEAVAKPTWSPAPQKKSEFKRPLRPSQILRERNASSGPRLVPIKSSLRSSMRSQVVDGTDDAPIDRGPVIRTNTPGLKRGPVRINPEDFLTHSEKVWGEKSVPQPLPPVVCTNGASAELVQAPKTTPAVPTSLPIPKPSPRTSSRTGQLIRTNGETHIVDDSSTIKMADSESLIENQFYQSMDNIDGVQCTSRFDDEGIYEEVRRPSKLMPPPLSLPRPSPLTSPTSTTTSRSPIPSSTWHHADSDGETETIATDGLDNISDLTCLTDLLDKCSGRHLSLLQNRPSALENLLSQLGWWSITPSSKPRQQLRGSADFVALAAGRFDPEEDSHRHEFLSLLASPAGQGPMILTEYGFDQKRIGLDRNPKDGMLYLHCSNPSCPRLGPTRVDRARSWRTCTNCFTAYCSTRCREQGVHAHNGVCTFGRARLVCGRILHQLVPSQQSGLTALAKAGTTRLGRGGIIIAFASAQDAEHFLARSAALPLKPQNQQAEPVAADRPSPSGLLAPPIYLTVEEVSKLDSKLAAPCKIYKPSVSYVLIVIVCAYDLEVVKCGRAVHLYKQSIILPFPGAAAVDTPRPQLPLLKETTISWTQPRTTKEEREAYSKRLQRTLRERGVSLRNSEPEVYKRLSTFVETGEAFDPVEFDFHDYYSNQVITCTIAPMKDAVIRQKIITRPDERHRNYPYKQNQQKYFHRPLKPRIGETEL